MIVVAGHLQVDPDHRAAYLAGCEPIVSEARTAPGCLDFALSPDLTDPGRINVYERWETVAAVETFRASGPGDDQAAHVRDADVRQFEVSTETGL